VPTSPALSSLMQAVFLTKYHLGVHCRQDPRIHLSTLTELPNVTSIVSLKRPNGNYHSFSTYADHRSAFYNLFQDYHRVMSRYFARELSSHFKGFQRKVAEAVGQECGQIKVGKDPMPLGL
jgi:hypothetical protein